MTFLRRRQMNELAALNKLAPAPQPREMTLADLGAILGLWATDELKRETEGACPKCGKELKARGRHLHINRCKG